MDSKQVLVVRTNLFLTPTQMEAIRKDLVKQMRDGVVILPACCEALVVPDGMDIQVECVKEKGSEALPYEPYPIVIKEKEN